MSIYRSRDTHPTYSDVTAAVTRSGAPMPASAPPDGDWTSARKAEPADHLLPNSVKWLTSLPYALRPFALANKYPRIANVLALDWSRPAECRAYLADLLMDSRGHRQGFPEDVDRDLRRLRDYYRGAYPTLDK